VDLAHSPFGVMAISGGFLAAKRLYRCLQGERAQRCGPSLTPGHTTTAFKGLSRAASSTTPLGSSRLLKESPQPSARTLSETEASFDEYPELRGKCYPNKRIGNIERGRAPLPR
jgi:hypothetical protein